LVLKSTSIAEWSKQKSEIFRKFQIWTGFEPDKILIFDSRFDHSAIE
jgi:hypothetical protein